MRSHFLFKATFIVVLAANVVIGQAQDNRTPAQTGERGHDKIAEAAAQMDAACRLLDSSGDSVQQKLVLSWKAATGKNKWKDKSGGYSTAARYISSDESSVVLEKEDGASISVDYENLDFNGRVRVKDIRKLKTVILANADSLREQNQADEKAQQRLAAMSPAEKKVRRFAKLQSDESRKVEKLLQKAIESADGDQGLRFRAGLAASYKLLRELEDHYKHGTLTSEVVKKAITETGGAGGTIKDLATLLFDTGKPCLAFILLDDEKLITRFDIYYQSARTLSPEDRKLYGFRYFEVFERQGDKLHWDYMLSKEIEANKHGKTALDDPDAALSGQK